MQDISIIGWWAAGLFCASLLPKQSKTTILEKSWWLGTKLLLSWGSRCNFSNANIDPLLDYFWQDKKSLPSLFHKFWNQEMINWLEENHIPTKQEENGRLILQSNKAKDLNNLLISKVQENDTEILLNQSISTIEKSENGFTIHSNDQILETKNLIIATGWKSFPQIWATDFGLQIAQQFGLEVVEASPGLCGIETHEDLATITGNTIICSIQLLFNNKTIYQQTGNLLFTHRWISGPIVFQYKQRSPGS
jgi:predicted Rossmann fold flavoprotein